MLKNDTRLRKEDSEHVQATQTSRFLKINTDWFFFTREKDLLGPYRSREIADHAVSIYVQKIALSAQSNSSKDYVKKTGERQQNDNVLTFNHPNWNV